MKRLNAIYMIIQTNESINVITLIVGKNNFNGFLSILLLLPINLYGFGQQLRLKTLLCAFECASVCVSLRMCAAILWVKQVFEYWFMCSSVSDFAQKITECGHTNHFAAKATRWYPKRSRNRAIRTSNASIKSHMKYTAMQMRPEINLRNSRIGNKCTT